MDEIHIPPDPVTNNVGVRSSYQYDDVSCFDNPSCPCRTLPRHHPQHIMIPPAREID
jgi:hypothetical protein